VPKKNKAVILLSSIHHDKSVSEETHKKLGKILYYNETKGGVDQMVQTYSCKRKINRWPIASFNLIDVASVVVYIIWATKNCHWNNNKLYRRRLFLRQLGRSLVDPHLNKYCQNTCAIQRGVWLALCSLGLSIVHHTTVFDICLRSFNINKKNLSIGQVGVWGLVYYEIQIDV